MDTHKLFAYSTIATAPSPATSGTSLVVATGDGALFPAPATDGNFYAVVYPAGAQPLTSNAEVIRCSARSTDTFSTIVRAQLGTAARTIVVGDQIFQPMLPLDLEPMTLSSNYVSPSVTMTTIATYYDGPTLTLAAGTYLLIGALLLSASSTATRTWKVRLWDGTTDISNTIHTTEGTAVASNFPVSIGGVVSPGSSTTYKISATSSVASDQILAGGSGTNLGSYLFALRTG